MKADEACADEAQNKPRKKNVFCGVVEGFYGRPWTSDQRKNLFERMHELGMNVYLYAPKDDLKHRAEWRLLYTPDEIDLLQSLIKAARSQGITFVYALSPGIDIIYSSEKEVKALEDKLMQVKNIGCEAFALLFDDIESTMHEQDKKKFPSFVVAQLTVANAMYEYLKCSQFFFCPTEYCESRACPSLEESDYLLTLGKKLLPDIYILWTGTRVVSRYIATEHIRRVATVLKRKPVIWDNLHANDYDPKRIFLGPFAGRSVKLKDEISGILLNPNCRYEANFVPFFTIAEWNSCHADAELEEDHDGASAAAILEAGGVAPVAAKIVEDASPKKLYHPLKALDESIRRWLDYFNEPFISSGVLPATHVVVSASEERTSTTALVPAVIRTCEGNELLPNTEIPPPLYTAPPIGSATTVTVQTYSISDAVMGVVETHTVTPTNVLSPTVNSLSVEYGEPMEFVSIIKDEAKPAEAEVSAPGKLSSQEMLEISSDVSMESSNNSEIDSTSVIDSEQISTFIDMFYLPFEHGRRGLQMLKEFSWLHENSYVVRKKPPHTDSTTEEEDEQAIVSDEWKRRCNEFVKSLRSITKFFQLVADIPNKAIVQELFQYIYDVQGIASVLEALVLWMGEGELNISPVERDNLWCNGPSDVEPWVYGAGLISDFHKLLFSTPRIAEFLLIKFVVPLTLNCYLIRPYKYEDEKEVRSFYNRLFDDIPADGGMLNETREERYFDRYIGPYVVDSTPRTIFVAVEQSNPKRIVGIVTAALNAKQFADRVHRQYIPRMRTKYNMYAEADKEEGPFDENLEAQWQRQHESIAEWEPLSLSEETYREFPSQIGLEYRSLQNDIIAIKRLIYTSMIALSFNGSTGVFISVRDRDPEKIDFLTKLGLLPIKEAGIPEDICLLGHSL
uniref:protein O-GlcNAcase n=1 Tax=Syphacia muris TaxID=451379 RepID=A0A0N5A9H2_9BILA